MRYTLTDGQYNTLAERHDEVRSTYAGRGMLGDICIAYGGDDVEDFIRDLAEVIADADGRDREELRDRLRSTKRDDALGLGMITYWTGIAVNR
ncbi:hypothetical protein GS896_25690 [Rhodococcus hoagii]|nr:hypothetical protein [Prescottella equi]MBM4654101.1 hypothetical protein [Prescottella equi]MBM4719575.1 hypothetical protein [Prescottella equi]NKR23374.1 hypothetical protein [Prescottella equi]NKT56015.1 hypothetical protein [Prescottella equi]